MNKTISFEEVINSKWDKTFPYDGHGPGASINYFTKEEDEDKFDPEEPSGIIFTVDTVWDEYKPLSHSMKDEDTQKLYSVLCHSNEMYKLLKSMDDERAKELINKIETDTEYPEN